MNLISNSIPTIDHWCLNSGVPKLFQYEDCSKTLLSVGFWKIYCRCFERVVLTLNDILADSGVWNFRNASRWRLEIRMEGKVEIDSQLLKR